MKRPVLDVAEEQSFMIMWIGLYEQRTENREGSKLKDLSVITADTYIESYQKIFFLTSSMRRRSYEESWRGLLLQKPSVMRITRAR